MIDALAGNHQVYFAIRLFVLYLYFVRRSIGPPLVAGRSGDRHGLVADFPDAGCPVLYQLQQFRLQAAVPCISKQELPIRLYVIVKKLPAAFANGAQVIEILLVEVFIRQRFLDDLGLLLGDGVQLSFLFKKDREVDQKIDNRNEKKEKNHDDDAVLKGQLGLGMDKYVLSPRKTSA